MNTRIYQLLNRIVLCIGIMAAGSAFGANVPSNLLSKESWLYMQGEDVYLYIKNNTDKDYTIKQTVGNQEGMKWPKVDILLGAHLTNKISPLLWENGKLGSNVDGLQFKMYPAGETPAVENTLILEMRVASSYEPYTYDLNVYLYPASEKFPTISKVAKRAFQRYIKHKDADIRPQTTILLMLGKTFDESSIEIEKRGVYGREDIKRLEEIKSKEWGPEKLSPEQLLQYKRK